MPPESRPPVAARRPHVHVGGGLRRPDPYAWMRDRSDPELLAYLEAERAHYEAATARLHPLRAELLAEMTSRTPAAESSVSWRHGRWVYHTRRLPGKEYVQFVRTPVSDPPGGAGTAKPQVLLDENTLTGEPGGHVSVGVREVSPDGRRLAYSVDLTGDERYELRFRDLGTVADLPDRVPGVSEGGAWLDDERFLWVEVDDSWRPWRVRLHSVGSPGGHDAVVLAEGDERFQLDVRRTRSGAYVVVRAESRDTVEEWLVPAVGPPEPRPATGRTPGVSWRVDHAPGPDGDRLVAVSDRDDPESSVLVTRGVPASWQPLAPAREGERVLEVHAFASGLVVTLRVLGEPRLRVLAPDGAPRFDVAPPFPAGDIALGPVPDHDAEAVLAAAGSYTEPTRWLAVDIAHGSTCEVHRQESPGYDPGDYVSSRTEVAARDGTRVPVTLARRADVPLDGSAPCLLYAYGAYESIDPPHWSAPLPSLLDRGVVFAHAHVRGGGELGRAWWQQGRLTGKPTTFSDLVDVADGLAAGVVDGRAIAARGLSAGGLLAAAVLTARPDRWALVVAEVPFVDVVTSMLDPSLPLTVNEWEEWGDPRDPAAAAQMVAWSPYDTVHPGRRPPVLVSGALHDTRVLVHEPAKWVAALRDADPSPVLFRAETGSGAHAGPTGRYAELGYEAEVLSVVVDALWAAQVTPEPGPQGRPSD